MPWLRYSLPFVLLLSPVLAEDPPRRVLKGAASGIRTMAVSAPLPLYPPEDVAVKKTGRVVVDITIESSGTVSAVEVVEMATPRMAAAVQTAVKSWKFEKSIGLDNKPSPPIIGRFIFYFKFHRGRPLVVDAAAEEAARIRAKTGPTK